MYLNTFEETSEKYSSVLLKFKASYEQFAICISLVTSFNFITHTSIPCFRAADAPHLAQNILYDIF